MGVDTGKETGTRGAANRDVAMGLGKGNAAAGQAGHVWGFCLRVPTKTLDVVIEVIANDKQDIRPVLCMAGKRHTQQQCDQEAGAHVF